MKKLALVTALALTALVTLPSQAATTTGTFDVNITLTTACLYTKTADVTFAYTSFQAAAATATPGGFNVRCTSTLPYSLALDALSTTDASTNLAYTLSLSATTGVGNGSNQAFTVTGNMILGQAGTCATVGVGAAAGTCTNSGSANKQRTLTITY